MVDYLNLQHYIIQRGSGITGFLTQLAIDDTDGNKLMTIAPKGVNGYIVKDSSGQEVGEIHGKVLTMHMETELYDANHNVIGVAKVMGFMENIGRHTIGLYDNSGTEMANAIGDVMGYEYTIADSSNKQIATITKNLGGSLSESLKESLKNAYKIDMTGTFDNRLLLLEFVIAVDHIGTTLSQQSRRSGPGFTTMGMGTGMPEKEL